MKQKDGCDFTGIISGTKGYICLNFVFSQEWDGLLKVLQTSNEYDFSNEHSKSIMNNVCMLPDEVTDQNVIYLRVIGKKGNKKMVTNTIILRQEG